jgi:phosphoribosyl-ATP pyrophosphohydrolase
MYIAEKKLWKDLFKLDPREFSDKIKEEAFEFGVAYCHWLDDKVGDEELGEEIADVFIQIQKLIAVYPELEKPFLKNLALKQERLKVEAYFMGE